MIGAQFESDLKVKLLERLQLFVLSLYNIKLVMPLRRRHVNTKRNKKGRSRRATYSRRKLGSSMVIARQTRGKRQPLVRRQHTFRLYGGRTLVTSGNKLTWGQVGEFGLFPEVNTRNYPNSFTPAWNSSSPYPANL